MFKSLVHDRKLLALLFLTLVIKLLSLNHLWVERFYTYGFYPLVSRLLRMLFGWIPFSIGDLLYAAAVAYLVLKVRKFVLLLKRRQVKKYMVWVLVKKLLYLALIVYIVFNLFWGLNYNRQGIATQLGLTVKPYTVRELTDLASVLQERMNFYGSRIDSVQRLELNKNNFLFSQAVKAYAQAKNQYPFLTYNNPSIKPSLYSHIGQYFGFTGYYNPFSGEAQLKTTVPVFLKPFIVTHEIGHQLGYGKENEANFVGYMACRTAPDTNFRYSVYFELALYALSDLRGKDSGAVHQFKNAWNARVQNDYRDFITYLRKSSNPIEPVVMRFYDQFLKMNNQPKGYRTYNEVIAWLIAYMKKYGKEAI